MNELIKVEEREGKQTVSARELYQFLELSQGQFSRWAKQNILENEFSLENEDYIGFDIMLNGNRTFDYSLTISFAKKLCMMARTEKGEQARQYFIECEKKLKEVSFKLPQTFSEALYLAAEQAKQIEQQNLLIEQQAPKVEFFDAVTGSKNTVDMAVVAKTLNFKKIGRNNLFEILRDLKILDGYNKPYQKYVDSGYFRLIETKYEKPDGSTHINFKTVVYQSGMNFIRKKLLNLGYEPK